MKKWNLPDKYAQIARDHHLENLDSSDHLMVIVRLSNKTCNKMGFGTNIDPDINLPTTPEAELLNFSEIETAKLEIALEDTKILQ
jgi:hypothetical protein